MAKAKTTRKTSAKATRSTNAKKAATRSTAKSATKKDAKISAEKSAAKTRTAKTKSDEQSPPSKKRRSAERIAVDRRGATAGRRKGTERRKQDDPVAVERRTLERRAKVNRRRQIDPTTCERDYTTEELEFMNALDEYKRTSGRMFPTCSEVLEVIRGLGYVKCTETANAEHSGDEQAREQSEAESHAAASVGDAVLIDINDAAHASSQAFSPQHAMTPSLDLPERDFAARVTF